MQWTLTRTRALTADEVAQSEPAPFALDGCPPLAGDDGDDDAAPPDGCY